jgi:choline dehydrogenase
LGIAHVHDLPGVGQNLQDHLQLRMIYRVEGARTLNTLANSWLGKARIGLEYLLTRRGPMSMAPSQLGVFAKSGPEQTRANVEYHVQPLSLERFGEPLHDFPAFTASICNVRPTSRGHVNIVSPDTAQAPEILCNYLSTSEDRHVAADSIRLTRRIVGQSALARFKPVEIKPGLTVSADNTGYVTEEATEEALAKAAGEIGTTIFHPVGTCKMGADAMAVVDDSLCVHGLAGLRVADASIMPTITSGNTNSPTMMIAEKAAQLILARAAR